MGVGVFPDIKQMVLDKNVEDELPEVESLMKIKSLELKEVNDEPKLNT